MPATPKAGAKASAKPKAKAGRGKEYALYTVTEGTHELTLVTTAKGANGNVAILNAVKADQTLAGVPFVPVLTTTIAKQISAAPKERNVVFEVKRHNAKRTYKRTAKPGPKPTSGLAGVPATPGAPKLNKDGTPRKKPGPKGGAKKAPAKKTAAKKPAAKKRPAAKKTAPPAPPVGANPFVG